MKSAICIFLMISCIAVAYAQNLKIGAFNIQILGNTKMDKPAVVTSLKQIIPRYDILLIQEIRDSSQTAIYELLNETNADISDEDDQYSMELSIRLGRSSSKEQYAFFYKHSRVSVSDTYQYPDTDDDFERPPFSVKFTATGFSDFFLTAIHTKPGTSETDAELNELDDVYDEVVKQFGIKDGMILGDFNADCTYVVTSNWPNIEPWTDNKFWWLIPHSADTVVKASSDCAYDRIVVAGFNMMWNIDSSSAGVFDFGAALNLNETEAKAVSDHFPVEVDVTPVGTVTSPASAATVFVRGVSVAASLTSSPVQAYHGKIWEDIDLAVSSRVTIDVAVTDLGEFLNDYKTSYPSLLSAAAVTGIETKLSPLDGELYHVEFVYHVVSSSIKMYSVTATSIDV